MNLTERLGELISACFTGIWIESHEHHDAIVEIAQLCHDEGWSFANWDIEQGMTLSGGETSSEASDPLAAVRSLKALASDDGTAVLVMNNLHRFIGSTEVMQAVQRQLVAGKQNRTILIVLVAGCFDPCGAGKAVRRSRTRDAVTRPVAGDRQRNRDRGDGVADWARTGSSPRCSWRADTS